jgi:putative NADPH-quinone reductase
MKRVFALNASPRTRGNTAVMLETFLDALSGAAVEVENLRVSDLHVRSCRGCLRCNLAGRCTLRGDDWELLCGKLLGADVLVFASPIYFRHVPAPLKNIIDRFRSFVQVQITETGLRHTPRHHWEKDFVLLLSMGSPDAREAGPVCDLFSFITEIFGSGNRLHMVAGTRLAVSRQVSMTEQELSGLYEKLGIPAALVSGDHKRNRLLLKQCADIAQQVVGGKGAGAEGSRRS